MDAAAMKHMASNFAKLDKFKRMDFRRWQKKMHFLISSISVVYVLTTPIPKDGGDDVTVEQIRKRANQLRIGESLRVQDTDKPKGNNVAGPSVVNMVEHNNSSRIAKVEKLATKLMVQAQMFQWMDDDVAWWVDSRARVYVCKDRCWFKTYESLNDGSILYMGNESTNLVHGRGCVDLRLGHVHFKRMQDMSKDGLILAFNMNNKKCKTCMLTKIRNKKYFVTFIDDASRAFVRLLDPNLKTLDERGIEYIFVGYAEHSKVFRFYVIELNDSVLINSIIESRDAIFNENRFSSVPKPSLRIPNRTEDIGGSVVPEEKEEINDEMESILGNNTWVLADLPPGCKPLGCKWIFKRKLKLDETIEKFKARLVIQGFKQKSGIDYFDTYGQVACISTIRLLIAMESIHNLIIHQMDIKIDFLNNELDEEVDLTKEFLSSRFSMKDMGEPDVILVIMIKHKMSTPMDTSEKLMPNNGQAVSQVEYSRVIGCLMYAMTCTRLDITFVMGKLSKYTSNPVLEGYVDACWISNTKYNSSTSGWVFLLGGGAISQASKKQPCITGSTMKSKFMALAAAGKKAEWLKNLPLEIPFGPNL
nr:zinc finger, CCHC-type [Tanacetum cinerariifolium]